MIKKYYSDLDIQSFLPCPTPDGWLSLVIQNLDILLIDHAHCEKKAATSAMSFLYHHEDKPELLEKMSKIAREELVHFEQVLRILRKRGIRYQFLKASRYVSELRTLVRTGQQDKFIDTLIIGAFIEARSCERFSKIAPLLDDELSQFYQGLLASECRHFTIYLNFARHYAAQDISERLKVFSNKEQVLMQSPDTVFRFHSGVVFK